MTIREIFQSFFEPYRRRRSRTVRYAFPLVFMIAAVLSAATIVSTKDTTIEVVSDQSTVQAGQQFKINVYVDSAVPVNAVDISLAFPDTQVKIDGIDTGGSVITLWTVQPYAKNGVVVLRGGTFNKGFLGKHLIATIKATASYSGLATFSVDKTTLLAGDGAGTKVPVAKNTLDTAKLYVGAGGSTTPRTVATNAGLEGKVHVNIVPDINGDGKVTLSDVSAFMSAWNAPSNHVYDFNGDGKMTFVDFAIILADSFFNQVGVKF